MDAGLQRPCAAYRHDHDDMFTRKLARGAGCTDEECCTWRKRLALGPSARLRHNRTRCHHQHIGSRVAIGARRVPRKDRGREEQLQRGRVGTLILFACGGACVGFYFGAPLRAWGATNVMSKAPFVMIAMGLVSLLPFCKPQPRRTYAHCRCSGPVGSTLNASRHLS